MAHVEYCTEVRGATAERPIRIYLNDIPIAVSQGSPHGLPELAVGYLLSEGLIADRESLGPIRADLNESVVYVASVEQAEACYVPLHCVTSAGCAQSVLLQKNSPIYLATALSSSARFSADSLLLQMNELCERSPRRNKGECVHGCGLGAAEKNSLELVREDIGRHNAMDKLIGQAWLDRIDVSDMALFITGRISTEMALKAHRAGCSVLVSCKSATDEAAARAEMLGVTLVSYCREGSMRVLSHGGRIVE